MTECYLLEFQLCHRILNLQIESGPITFDLEPLCRCNNLFLSSISIDVDCGGFAQSQVVTLHCNANNYRAFTAFMY